MQETEESEFSLPNHNMGLKIGSLLQKLRGLAAVQFIYYMLREHILYAPPKVSRVQHFQLLKFTDY